MTRKLHRYQWSDRGGWTWSYAAVSGSTTLLGGLHDQQDARQKGFRSGCTCWLCSGAVCLLPVTRGVRWGLRAQRAAQELGGMLESLPHDWHAGMQQTQSLVLVGLWSMHKLLSLNPSTQRPALPLAAWQRCTPCESHGCHVCKPAICHATCLRLPPSCPGPPRCLQIPRELHSHTIIF